MSYASAILANYNERYEIQFCTVSVRVPLDLGGRGGGRDLLARKSYAMPKCVSVEIGMQAHLNCMKKQKRSQFPHYMNEIIVVIFNSVTSINSLILKKEVPN